MLFRTERKLYYIATEYMYPYKNDFGKSHVAHPGVWLHIQSLPILQPRHYVYVQFYRFNYFIIVVCTVNLSFHWYHKYWLTHVVGIVIQRWGSTYIVISAHTRIFLKFCVVKRVTI